MDYISAEKVHLKELEYYDKHSTELVTSNGLDKLVFQLFIDLNESKNLCTSPQVSGYNSLFEPLLEKSGSFDLLANLSHKRELSFDFEYSKNSYFNGQN